MNGKREEASNLGREMYALAEKLYPITRSITGNGVRQTHGILRSVLPGLQTQEIRTGERCFDWTIPDEWNIDTAFIETLDGHRVVDFNKHNLHVVMYSEPVDRVITREELEQHLIYAPGYSGCHTVYNLILQQNLGILFVGKPT